VDIPSRVSIALCTCNGEAYLDQQLESILAQTVPPTELIVSDDASTDGTVRILNSFRQRAPFPVLVHVNKARLGVCKNFENAIRHCSGDVIFLSDQDDVWIPSKIATMLNAFETHPRCGYVFSNAELIDEHGNYIGRNLWTSIGFDQKLQRNYADGNQLQVMLRWYTVVYGMTMAFRAAFIPQLMPFECRFSRAVLHDGWVPLFLSSIGAYGVALPDRLVKYRQHPTQLASAGRPLRFLDLVRINRSQANEQYMDFGNLLEHLAARLQQFEPQSQSVRNAREHLIGKATHVRARIHANSSRGMERIKTVFFEAVSGRYGRYSRSFKSVLKDLMG
jgi:glycosyltransferase involved in cell wall biosynthesis